MSTCNSASSAARGVRRACGQCVVLILTAVLLASCAAAPPAAPPAAPAPPPPLAASNAAAVAAGPIQSQASSIDAYKRDVARHIYRNRPDERFDGAPPPLLRSVVVLAIRVDPAGNPVRIAVVRSNGYVDLEQAAIHSVRASAPLPMPSRIVARSGPTEYFETWLFRDDGRYQIRSLAEVQSSGED